MRSGLSRFEHLSIPSGDAVSALAGILTEMNGSPDPGCSQGPQALSDTNRDELLGYQIEASAILDQLAAKGFVISKASRDLSLGPKVRETSVQI
jgi:hypothetical protein